jgi:phage tail-like protein
VLTLQGRLIIQREGKVVQTLPLNILLIKIGRSPESELSLPHEQISRHHAEIRVGPQGPILTDLGSANGTFIGTRRLLPNQPLLLVDGSTFRVGPYLLIYQASGDAPAVQPQEDLEKRPFQSPVSAQAQPEPLSSTASMPSQPTRQSTPQPLPSPASVARSRSVSALQKRRLLPASLHAESTFLRSLPDIYQENDFLRRFLLIFESIWEPLEWRQDHIEMYVDPCTCPAAFLPWLASWLDLPYHPGWPEARSRRLLTQGMELYRWRGTRYGLALMIEVCTGSIPTITEVPGQPYVFRIQVALPSRADEESVNKELLEELIQVHKPAHTGYILEIIS